MLSRQKINQINRNVLLILNNEHLELYHTLLKITFFSL